jgi:coniferyl-aldehyde dehydrogenase
MHITQEEMPFGGVGPSGMGSYHGYDGFREFSHRKSVFRQLAKDIPQLVQMRPPFGKGFRGYVRSQIKA